MDAALDGVQRNGEVGGIGGEDGNGIAGLELVNGGLVGICIDLVVGGK